jgi:hypothetical protein
MKLIWVHPDCLHRHSAAYRANPESPSIFVWDDGELKRTGWSMKRIGFVYECLLDLPVIIRRGDPLREVPRFMKEAHCQDIVTTASPDPRIRSQAQALNAEIVPAEPFVEVKGPLDLRRFSRYWTKVAPVLIG